jgi:DNA relaxase NicK
MHCESKGFLTERWVEFVRLRWPGKHYLTRLDICMDLDQEGAFQMCLDAALDVMRKFDLTEDMRGDWIKGEKGRTYYLGSRTSVAYLRIYEKGKKDDQERPDWVRVELEIKPPAKWEPMRWAMASSEPGTLWGVTEWTAELYERITGMRMQVLERPKPPKTQYDKRLEWLALQAHGALQEVVQRVGEHGLWDEIERVRMELQEAKKRAA